METKKTKLPAVSESWFLSVERLLSVTLRDLHDGLCLFRYWFYRSIINYKLGYADTRLGLIWPNISLCLLVVILGTVWGVILGRENPWEYYLYLSAGYPVWQVLANSVTQGLVGAPGFNRGNGLPISVFLYERCVLVAIRFFSVSPSIIFAVVILSDGQNISQIMWVPFALLNLFVWSFSILTSFTVLVTLKPDFRPFVNALMGLAFLATPIIWEPSRLGIYQDYVWFNPFFLPLEFARYSFTGIIYDLRILWLAPIYSLGLLVTSLLLFSRHYNILRFRAV